MEKEVESRTNVAAVKYRWPQQQLTAAGLQNGS